MSCVVVFIVSSYLCNVMYEIGMGDKQLVCVYCGLGICVMTVVVVDGHSPNVAVGRPYNAETSSPCKPRSSLNGYDKVAVGRGMVAIVA